MKTSHPKGPFYVTRPILISINSDKYGKILAKVDIHTHMGSSTETVAFQVYEILKINYEFLQFF